MCQFERREVSVFLGKSFLDIAATLHTRPARVSKWRQRFAQHGLSGLLDSFRSGRPRQYDDATERQILAQLLNWTKTHRQAIPLGVEDSWRRCWAM